MPVYGREPRHSMPADAGMTSNEVIPAQAGIQALYTHVQTSLVLRELKVCYRRSALGKS